MNGLGETKGTDGAKGTEGVVDSQYKAVGIGNVAVNFRNEAVGSENELS